MSNSDKKPKFTLEFQQDADCMKCLIWQMQMNWKKGCSLNDQKVAEITLLNGTPRSRASWD